MGLFKKKKEDPENEPSTAYVERDEPEYPEESADAQSQPTPQPSDERDEPDEKPRRTVPLFIAVIGMLIAAVLTCQITFLAVRMKYAAKLAEVQAGQTDNQKLSEIDDIYRKYYIGEIDDDKLGDGLIEGYIYGVGDKYGNYMTADEYKDYVNSLNSQLDGGIGVSATHNTDYNAIEILRVYEGTPADEGGILEGDLIISVDGVSVSEAGYETSINSIRGEKGQSVTLTLRRGENYAEELTVTLVRASITIQTVSYKVIDNIGVISISNFYSDTADGLKTAVEAVKAAGCDRLIFDVRYNSGGLLTSIEAVLDYLLPEGTVVRVVDAQGNETRYSSDSSFIDMPMTVLVNGSTASAAELFTSALMEYAKAGKADVTVIGTQTYGKGTVTRPYSLSDGSVVYISYALYYPADSESNFEGVGITPDIVLELSEEAQKINFYKLTLETDNQLRRAVEVIKEK